MIKNRAHLAGNLLSDGDLDALVLTDLANIRYLCGFSGTDGVLVVTATGSFFLTDSRYTTQARAEVVADAIREYSVKIDGVVALLEEVAARRIGFESETLPYAVVERLRAKGKADWEWLPLGKGLLSLRGLKGEEEVAAMLAATRMNAEAFEEILPLIRPGAVERDVALALEFALKKRGAEEKAFDFIVASGPRGAMPHGIASERRIAAGELVTIDFGVRCGGYHSDETVTVAVGEIPAELQRVYSTVLAAHDLAIARIKPGESLRAIDAVARELIAAAGYGDYFGHGLGHGVGLMVHEYPTVSPRSEEIAREGMVFTVEPGIYIPEVGGVRIEDMVQVIAGGCRPLTCISKELRVLPV